MQPTQPDPSSAEPSADVQAAEAPSEDSPRVSNFLQRLWRGGGRNPEPEPEEKPEPAETSASITLTQEDLEKRIQAEADRREYRRAEAAKAERKRKLRDEDPWAYVEEERSAERAAEIDAQTSTWLGNVGVTHDRFTVDPVVMALPETERNRILSLEGAGVGLDGRKLIVEEGLRALEKHWKAEGAKDAETRLRRNPAFRKQVLSEFRRGMTEPEFIGSGVTSAADKDVSSILRQTMSTHRSL